MRACAGLLLVAMLASSARAAPEADWVVIFANGDTLHCRLHALDGDRLVVYLAISPDETTSIDLRSIASLGRAEAAPPEVPAADGVDVLHLNDDAVLYGRALSIRPDGVDFEVEHLGRMSFPAGEISDLARGQPQVALPSAKEGEFVVALRRGNVLAGKLLAEEDGRLTLASDGLTARIDPESIVALAYPPPPVPPEIEPEPKTLRRGVQVLLRGGSRIGGADPALGEGLLRMKLASGEVAVPLAEVATLAFDEIGGSARRARFRSLLVWGRWSDADDEFRKTIDIVKSELGGPWPISESTAPGGDPAFRRDLFAARTLLVPEMEKFNEGASDAREMRPLLEAFLRSGGNVVVCGASGSHVRWMSEAGLMDVEATGTVDGSEISFTQHGTSLGKGIGSFAAMNATTAYRIKGADTLSLAETPAAGQSVVVGRRVGRGWVICIGLDYYSTNEGASKLLANAIRLR